MLVTVRRWHSFLVCRNPIYFRQPGKMASFLREHSSWVAALSTGILIGASSTVLYYKKFGKDLLKLSRSVDELRREVNELRDSLAKKKRSGFYSVHPSSGDEDDDVYEEAFDGRDDLPRVASLQSTSSSSVYYSDVSHENLEELKTDLFTQIDQLLEGGDRDKERAYKLLRNRKSLLSSDTDFLWRYAKATFMMSTIEGDGGDEEKKKELVFESKDLAYTALSINENDSNIQKWCAITLGSANDYLSTQEKIANGFKFKQHIEKAISINSKDPSSHYLLGRWCYGVYMLSWLERKVASTLFANPPTSTVEEALEHFLEADKLNPGKWKENLLYVAKCYIEKRDYASAAKYLQKASNLPALTADDKNAEVEISSLLLKYGSYGS
ncbi:regulator of microtubule dynamics protein 1-like [Tubulanus polymorphus]|uniref:regulator of microtubule dynamics protein 1-like n=1 Tax=Tubulanus polymorphus TaxID=672921 RepID=UPI003DA4673A